LGKLFGKRGAALEDLVSFVFHGKLLLLF